MDREEDEKDCYIARFRKGKRGRGGSHARKDERREERTTTSKGHDTMIERDNDDGRTDGRSLGAPLWA